MGWLKIQKLEYLEDRTSSFNEIKNFLMCLRWHILKSYRFVAKVTFKTNFSFFFLNDSVARETFFIKIKINSIIKNTLKWSLKCFFHKTRDRTKLFQRGSWKQDLTDISGTGENPKKIKEEAGIAVK